MDFWRNQSGAVAVSPSIIVLGFSALLEGYCIGGAERHCWGSQGPGADGQMVMLAENSVADPAGGAGSVLEDDQAAPSPETPVARLVPMAPITERLNTPARRSTLCVDPQAWADPDIDRNKQLIDHEAICVSAIEISENGLDWRIQVLDSGRPGNNWILLHDDEDTAFDSALYAIVRYGGKVVDVHLHSSASFSRRIDPNKNFASMDDQTGTCAGAIRSAAPVFTSTIVEQLGDPPYLSLHNNYDGHHRNGGNGNMSVWHSTPELIGLPAFGAAGRLADEDNFILVSGLSPPTGLSDRLSELIDEMRSSGINVIYEYVREDSYDCSLSHYLLLFGGAEPGDYFNIESEFGDYRSQTTMIDALIGRLSNPLRASP